MLKMTGCGSHMFHIDCSCPTFADDMLVASLSKLGLEELIKVCYDYSLRWRFSYNVQKCAVIVFNESKTEFHKSSRQWSIGNCFIEEVEKFKHLGIICNKYLSLDDVIHDSCSKLKNTFLSLISSGIHENGFHPINCKKIYNSAVIPKALFGCELWNGLLPRHNDTLEKAHRFCIKFMQSLPGRTRTDVALSLLGVNPIANEIDYKKLIFFQQLCSDSVACVTKEMFIYRLVNFIENPKFKIGFIPDIFKILNKYSLKYILDNFLETGTFMPKYTWKRLIRKRIDNLVKEEWYVRLSADLNLCNLLTFHDGYDPCSFWKASRGNLKLLKCSQSCVKLIGMYFTDCGLNPCRACGERNINQTEHIILYCKSVESQRNLLWQNIVTMFGFKSYKKFINLCPSDQVISLFSSLKNILTDRSDIAKCENLIMYSLHNMLRIARCNAVNN